MKINRVKVNSSYTEEQGKALRECMKRGAPVSNGGTSDYGHCPELNFLFPPGFTDSIYGVNVGSINVTTIYGSKFTYDVSIVLSPQSSRTCFNYSTYSLRYQER